MPYTLERRLAPFFLLALLGMPLCGARPAAAQPPAQALPEPWERAPLAAPAAEVLAAAEKAGAAGESGVLVLFSERSDSFDEQGRVTSTWRMVYKIGPQGAHESWSTVAQGWSPWHQERPALRARVITPDGAVHDLDPATVAENAAAQGAPDLFEDHKVLRAPLPAVGPGAVVEQETTVRDSQPFFAAGVVSSFTVATGIPVRHARLTIEAPEALPLRWAARLLPETPPREEVAGGRRRLVFEYRDVEAAPDVEPGLPGDAPRVRAVSFATGRTWSEIAGRYSQLVDERLRGADLSSFLRAAGPAPSQLELIGRLLARLHKDVRYTGIELGLESIVPRTPAETLKRRYGDCKDQAALLAALLRASEIPAYVALLSAGDDMDVVESLPGLGAFNHAIVFVPGTPPLWIDPTDPFSRAGELPAGDQGRLALVAAPSTTGLVRTPEASSADNREVDVHELELADLGPARLVLTTELSGAFERENRASWVYGKEDALRKAYEEVLATTYLAEKLDGLDHGDPRDLTAPFRLRFEARRCGRGATDLKQAAVGIPLSVVVSRLPEELRQKDEEKGSPAAEPEPARVHDYVLPAPYVYEARYKLTPPAGYVLRKLPEGRTRQLGPAVLTDEYAAGPSGVVTATVRFDTVKRRLTPAELTALTAGIRDLREEPTAAVWWDQKGETLLEAGQTRAALDEFRGLAAAAPAKALPQTRLARALLAGGLGDAAREAARRAVALEPGSAVAQSTLGWVLQHDAIGRRFGEGWDRAGAIAAYQKAKQLDPKGWEARGDLAILLEHNPDGERYGPGADLDGAIAEYRTLRDEQKVTGLDDNLVIALLRAGRAKEVRELLAKIAASDPRAALGLAATAVLDGADAAVREAGQRFADPAGRVTALRAASANLVLLRRYQEAATLLRQAGRLSSDDAATLLAQADLFAKVRRHEEVDLPRDQPGGAARRILMVGVSQPGPEELKGLLSRQLLAHVKPEDIAGMVAGAQRGSRGDMPLDFLLDVFLAALRESVDGDEATGYRVRLDAAAGSSANKTVLLLAREGSELKLVAVPEVLGGAGLEALRRLDAGDLAGARRWLDWAREEVPAAGADDPLDGSAFALLWTKGAAAGADEARCAAAALAMTAFAADDLVPALERCRDAAAEPLRKAALEMALATGALRAKRWPDVVAGAGRLEALAPSSVQPFILRMLALAKLRRWSEMEAAAGERLAAKPDDPTAIEALSDAARLQGQFDKFAQLIDRLSALGKASANDYNNLAWSALFRGGPVADQDIENAQRAASLEGYKQSATLHTLAALYAEVGKTAEAYKVILQSLDAKDRKPDGHDWYVFGRLAEDYGLPEAARAYYARVAKDEEEQAPFTSTWLLAQRRLTGLGRK